MKKSKKLLSVLLSFVMVLSAIGATLLASAQNVYKPAYSEDVTEQDIADLIGDINTILNKEVLNGATIEKIYKMLPKLKSVVYIDGVASDKGEYYKSNYAERFANFPSGQIVDDEFDKEGALVTAGTFTAFFKENPVKCATPADFQKELNTIIDLVVCDNLRQVLYMVPVMGATDAPELGNGIDLICKALGVKQEDKFSDICGFNLMTTGSQGDTAKMRVYLKNIVNTLFNPNVADSVINIVSRITFDDNGALVYAGANKVLSSLSSVLGALKTTLTPLGVDVSAVQAKVEEIKTTFESFPTTGEGDAKMLNLEGTVSALIASLTDGALALEFIDRAEKQAQSRAVSVSVFFRHMKLDRIQNAESTADVVKIIYDYLYENLIADTTNNLLISTALNTGIIESALKITLSQEVKDFINKALKMSNDELMGEAIVAAANAAGRELPKPEPPTEAPTEAPTEKPTEVVSTETPTEPTTATQLKDVNIPKTSGKTTAVAGLVALAVASAAGLVVVAKKKES